MAARKDKLLESAQKSLKKKQVSRAIKDYIKVVEIDPADVRSRQKLAELLVKSGRNAEAYEHFESVAKYFSTNGFYLKAIAIYKQMQRLDSSQVALYSRLAELNEKQGLIGNAMAEYRNLVAYYERNGMTADVIKVLEKMRDLDTTNLNVRVKLAEVYATNDRSEEGLAEFEGVLENLSEKNDFDKILKLYKMFMPLFPENRKLKTGLALTLYEKGEYEKGITILVGLLQDKPEDPDTLRIIARGYADLEEWDKAGDSYQQLLALDPTDLDTRELYIKCLMDSGQNQAALGELEEWKDRFLKADRLEILKLHYETLKDRMPDNVAVLETLDSIYELTGEGGKILDIMSEKEDEQPEPVDEESLSDSILGSAEEDIELPSLELELEDADAAPASEEDPEELLLETPEEDFDLELDSLDSGEATAAEEEAEDAAESVIELDISAADEFAADAEELDLSFDLQADEDAEPASAAPDVAAQLEEAEFYIQQGLYDEAERLCTDILTQDPGNEECQNKLNVILSHQGEQEDSAVVQVADQDADEEEETEEIDFFNSLEEDSEDQKVFRTDVDEQIAADDMESHYNLGIAYREMGLFEDAISEFEKAEKDPSRFVDCQTLKGLCYSDKGDYANAELMYQQALDSPHLEAEQRLNLSFELASLYEASERFEEALSSYRVVLSMDEGYRDVKAKVASLQESMGIDAEEEPITKERISFL